MGKIASVPPRQVLLIDKAGRVEPTWHRFFIAVEKAVNESKESNTVSTVGSGDGSGGDDSTGDVLQALANMTKDVSLTGNNKEVQFNNQGSLYSDSRLLWDKTLGVLETDSGRIHSETRIINTDSPYTLLVTDGVIFADTDGGDITINIPVGVAGTCYEWYNVGSSGNTLTVDPNGTETLLGGGDGVSATFEDEEGAIVKYNSTEGWR